MAYILRTHIKSKYLVQGLKTVYGIGSYSANNLCRRLGFQNNFLIKNISDEEIYQIGQCIENLKLNLKGDLQRWLKQKIDHLINLKVYRGIRHRQGLPLRGQRTHTNARTAKRFTKFKK